MLASLWYALAYTGIGIALLTGGFFALELVGLTLLNAESERPRHA